MISEPDYPLVSIVTPVYNSAEFLRSTLDSICSQSFSNFELIIVDDGSTDDSLSILEQYALRDPRIRIIRLLGNNGPAKARNIAIKSARGRYIAFNDSDDIWLPDKLEYQLSFMNKNGAAVSFTSYYKMNEDGIDTGSAVIAKPVVTYKDLLKSNYIGCSTAIYDTNIVGKQYMPDIIKRQDYGLWLMILRNGHIAYGLDKLLVRYRIRVNSVSSNKLIAAQYHWRVLRDVAKLTFLKSLFYFIHYAFIGLKKHRD